MESHLDALEGKIAELLAHAEDHQKSVTLQPASNPKEPDDASESSKKKEKS